MYLIWIAVNIRHHTTWKVPSMASMNGRETSHQTVMPTHAPCTIQWHTIQHAQDIPSSSFLYVDLRCAIRYEHGLHIVRLWKLCLPRLIQMGTGRKIYAVECVHQIANQCAELPKHLSFIAIYNRTVNVEGKAGRGKLLDQIIEYYNL